MPLLDVVEDSDIIAEVVGAALEGEWVGAKEGLRSITCTPKRVNVDNSVLLLLFKEIAVATKVSCNCCVELESTESKCVLGLLSKGEVKASADA